VECAHHVRLGGFDGVCRAVIGSRRHHSMLIRHDSMHIRWRDLFQPDIGVSSLRLQWGTGPGLPPITEAPGGCSADFNGRIQGARAPSTTLAFGERYWGHRDQQPLCCRLRGGRIRTASCKSRGADFRSCGLRGWRVQDLSPGIAGSLLTQTASEYSLAFGLAG
jgi:hypothetical protein